MKLITKIFEKYKKTINQVITFIGSVFIYFIGISLGSLTLHLTNKKVQPTKWQPINLGSDPKVMY